MSRDTYAYRTCKHPCACACAYAYACVVRVNQAVTGREGRQPGEGLFFSPYSPPEGFVHRLEVIVE